MGTRPTMILVVLRKRIVLGKRFEQSFWRDRNGQKIRDYFDGYPWHLTLDYSNAKKMTSEVSHAASASDWSGILH